MYRNATKKVYFYITLEFTYAWLTYVHWEILQHFRILWSTEVTLFFQISYSRTDSEHYLLINIPCRLKLDLWHNLIWQCIKPLFQSQHLNVFKNSHCNVLLCTVEIQTTFLISPLCPTVLSKPCTFTVY